MRKIILVLVVTLACTAFTRHAHKFYLSVTEIEYKPEKEDLQIVSRVFINDFQDVLEKRYGTEIRLSKEKEQGPVKQLIQKYLNTKFHISVDGKPIDIEYLGKKYEDDQLVLFLEGTHLKPFKKIAVTNAILTDLFDEQKNVINVKINDEVKSILLRKEADTDMLNFGN
ncbi:DUF6702 family protein [Zunongwangia sp.]|uniref:DUF6702 family protein n=1 Tax=Zunongwangia sp. TaxID=1965325 RepID=UPI003AA82737